MKKSERRVRFHRSVAPITVQNVKQIAKRFGESESRAVDRAVALLAGLDTDVVHAIATLPRGLNAFLRSSLSANGAFESNVTQIGSKKQQCTK